MFSDVKTMLQKLLSTSRVPRETDILSVIQSIADLIRKVASDVEGMATDETAYRASTESRMSHIENDIETLYDNNMYVISEDNATLREDPRENEDPNQIIVSTGTYSWYADLKKNRNNHLAINAINNYRVTLTARGFNMGDFCTLRISYPQSNFSIIDEGGTTLYDNENSEASCIDLFYTGVKWYVKPNQYVEI